MKKYLSNFIRIIRHKYYVAINCFKYGLFLQGIFHDVSKFFPIEFIAYSNYFFGKDKKEKEFYSAFLSHQNRNKHHWQYWILIYNTGCINVLPMPDKYIKEMICDWIGAGKSVNDKDDVLGWYNKNKDKMILNDKTRRKVEMLLLEIKRVHK